MLWTRNNPSLDTLGKLQNVMLYIQATRRIYLVKQAGTGRVRKEQVSAAGLKIQRWSFAVMSLLQTQTRQ
jgi:hypothetical protein